MTPSAALPRFPLHVVAIAAALALAAPSWALTGVQVGASGATYASAGIQCALNPVAGMAPVVHAGLYNPKKNANATVSQDGSPVARVTFQRPDATVWLVSGIDTVTVAINPQSIDRYDFDAAPTFPGQPNVCIPDTRGNTLSGDLEYAASMKSTATVTPGCAFNPLTGRAQPFVNLFDNGTYLLNVSVNNVALTQLNGTTRTKAAIFLSPGLNVISAAAGSISTDDYVRDGGTGICTLP